MIQPISIIEFSEHSSDAQIKENLLRIRTVNECISDAQKRPIPKMLFSEFWHEGELCILFADTNSGKSILAVQIANCISNGEVMKGFRFEAHKQPVLYVDFEMSDKQFQKRYSLEYETPYRFDDTFYRITLDPNCTNFDDFENSLFTEIESALLNTGSKVLIIDNITYLKTQATDTAKEALPLMKKLIELKKKYELSILVLAHTPKRNRSIPISKNDLAGSKHLANFADSMFAIGESYQDYSFRYLKQLKSRATEIKYGDENVIICQLSKPANFLRFDFFEFDFESKHLLAKTSKELEELDLQILDLRQKEPNISNSEIAKRLNTNKMRVGRVLNKANSNR